MDLPSLIDAFNGFLLDEPATLNGESNEIVEWKSVLEKIMVEMKKEPQLREKLEKWESVMKVPVIEGQLQSSRDSPFISCLLTNATVKKMIGEYAAKCKQHIKADTSGKKNPTKAASIRLQGNSLFVKKEYRATFKMFTRGLMFAKDDDEETPLLYANRSAVYFYMKQFENALEDIERAFKFGYGNLKPTGKLLIRKGFSLLALGRDAEVKELLDANMPANENEPDFAQWQQLKKESENVNRQIIKRDITMSQFQDVSTIRAALSSDEVFRPHERFPWLNAKVDLRYDAEKGYHLVSKEELKYGEIVALSKPYVSLDPKRESYERCHYCMVPCFEVPKYFSDKANLAHEPKLSSDSLRMLTPLACPECSNVLYCSEACRTAAWTAYHRFECSQMAILTKVDSKANLALRMLYMIGSQEEKNSPNAQMSNLDFKAWVTMADPCAFMVDQQAYSFVFSNPDSKGTLKENVERVLTVGFLLKLTQMSGRFGEPKNDDAKVYTVKAINAYSLLLTHFYQGDMIENVPFTDPATGLTVSPVLHVDGMKSMLKHSCEATVATSSLLTESFESNVKLLYATGDIPAGTMLTLAYYTEELCMVEQITKRKWILKMLYTLDCTCTRCVREERDCLDLSDGIYYPIACSCCGSLMVRASEGGNSFSVRYDSSYRCSSTDGCTFKYSAQQMKNVYKRVNKMLETKRNTQYDAQTTYRTFQPKVYQLKTAIESTAPLLYGRSVFLAHQYRRLASCYLLISMAPISNRYSEAIRAGVTTLTHTINRDHLTAGLLYTNKVFDILESLNQEPGVTTQFAEQLFQVFDCLNKTEELFKPLLLEMLPPIEQVRRRYEAFLKMTAYDTMVASSLRDQITVSDQE